MEEQLPIGSEQARKAAQILETYRSGKANLEKRVIENQQWFQLRHWECMRKSKASPVEPASGWLFNCIANKHADAMDNFPAPSILPREAGDQGEARALSAILPVILEQNGFEGTYDQVWDDKLRSGTGIYGVFWDPEKLGGLGDIAIRQVDVLSLFWEGGITDIQKSRNLFHVELRDNDLLEAEYPQLAGTLGSDTGLLSRYVCDDTVDTSGKSALVDWYYKRNGRLHYCKFVGDTVLFATENDPKYRDRGWYDHGLYPFVFDPLFRCPGSPCGFGYIDVGKSAQEYIDRGNQAILQNLLCNVRPRHFIRADGEVNEEEYADMTKDFIHVGGNLGQDSILPVQGKPLSEIYVQVINNKVDELKETTGNRDISTGGTASGVTAASAIAAMQEAGSKLSRDNIKASYRCFRQVCLLAIELIRQFYDLPRAFRILGPQGGGEFIRYSNAGLRPQHQGYQLGVDLGWRKPLFDISVSTQKQSPYSRLSQNELALQFFGAGFFDPRLTDQALACLEMMDFERKEFIMARIAQNGQAWAQASRMAGEIQPRKLEALGGSGEPSATRNARVRAAQATAPG